MRDDYIVKTMALRTDLSVLRCPSLLLVACWIASGCAPDDPYASNTAPLVRIVSHTDATTVFTDVETEFLGEATDPDQVNKSLTAHWSIEGTVGCPDAPIVRDIGSTRCSVILDEPGTIAVSLEVIDDEGESSRQDLTLTVVQTIDAAPTALVVEPPNTYSATLDVTLETVEVALGGNPQVDWCSLTTDDRGRTVDDANTLSRAEIREFTLVPSELELALSAGELDLDNALSTYIFYNGSELCSAPTSAMRDGTGVQFDPAAALQGDGHSWLVTLHNADAIPSFDPLASAVMVAHPSGGGEVVLDDVSSDLGFTPDLLSLEHLRTVAGADAYTLDWSALTTDSLGNPFDSVSANRLFIAQSSDDLVSLQQSLLSLETHADAFYRRKVGNSTSTDLMTAENDLGEPFPGFTEEGVWLVGIECNGCTHPAPVLLTVVDVDPAD